MTTSAAWNIRWKFSFRSSEQWLGCRMWHFLEDWHWDILSVLLAPSNLSLNTDSIGTAIPTMAVKPPSFGYNGGAIVAP
jgi:hypothetical protein